MTPGIRIGHLILLRSRHIIDGRGVRGGPMWSCWCDCGGFVQVREHFLARGRRKSCDRCREVEPKPA